MASLFFVKENGVSSQSLIIRRKKTVEQETSGLVSMVLVFQILLRADTRSRPFRWRFLSLFFADLTDYRHQEFQFPMWYVGGILEQKVSTQSLEWVAAISLSHLREHWYYLVLSSNIRVTRDKMKTENNPIRLPLETWCSLSVPQCTASNTGNWNSWCLYCVNCGSPVTKVNCLDNLFVFMRDGEGKRDVVVSLFFDTCLIFAPPFFQKENN